MKGGEESGVSTPLIKLTEEDLKLLREEDWEEVNSFLQQAKNWTEKTSNPKSHCPLK